MISNCWRRHVFLQRRSGSRMLGPSSDGTFCVRRTQVWTKPRTAPPCPEERLPDRPQRSPTPPWARPAPPPPSQTLQTPPCRLSPPYWPPCRAAWTFTNAGVPRRARWPASSDVRSQNASARRHLYLMSGHGCGRRYQGSPLWRLVGFVLKNPLKSETQHYFSTGIKPTVMHLNRSTWTCFVQARSSTDVADELISGK